MGQVSYNRHILQNAAGLAPREYWARASLIDDYGVDPTRIEVIPPGVDVAAWQPADHAGDGPMKILFVGFDFERKGGDVLLRAFDALPAGTAQLRIVTQSPCSKRSGVEVHRGLSPNDPALRDPFPHQRSVRPPQRVRDVRDRRRRGGGGRAAADCWTSVGGLGDLVVDGVTGFPRWPPATSTPSPDI